MTFRGMEHRSIVVCRSGGHSPDRSSSEDEHLFLFSSTPLSVSLSLSTCSFLSGLTCSELLQLPSYSRLGGTRDSCRLVTIFDFFLFFFLFWIRGQTIGARFRISFNFFYHFYQVYILKVLLVLFRIT